LNGKEINLTSDNTIIKSTNFNVDKDGNMTCKSASMQDANINGGSISLNAESYNSRIKISDDKRGRILYLGPNYWEIHRTSGDVPISTGINTLGQAFFRLESTSIWADGITTPVVTQTSLERVKKNINKADTNALELIKNSDIYEYNLKSEEDTDKKHIGFVIGDKYNTPNEVISKSGEGIDTYSMASIMWKAIQELTARVEQLEKEVANGKN